MTEDQKNIASEAVAAVLREVVCANPDMSAAAMKDIAVGAATAMGAAFAELDKVSLPCS